MQGKVLKIIFTRLNIKNNRNILSLEDEKNCEIL
jgi:hypothetical protein